VARRISLGLSSSKGEDPASQQAEVWLGGVHTFVELPVAAAD